MKEYIEKYLANLKKIQHKRHIRYLMLAILVVITCFVTNVVLKQNAVTMSGLICNHEEHLHTIDKCYDIEDYLICKENHEHHSKCYQRIATLNCNKQQHEHINICYRDAINTNGIVGQIYSKDIILVVDENNNPIDEEPVLLNGIKTMSVANIMTTNTGDTGTTPPSDTTTPPAGLNLANYKTKVVLKYKNNKGEWGEIGDTPIPANSEILLEYYYDNLNKSELIANHKTVYYRLPEQFKSNITASEFAPNGKPVCSVNVENDYIILTFYDEWLEDIIGTTFEGHFGMDLKVDPNKIVNNQITVNFGDVNKTINFEDNWDAKMADLKVIKSGPETFYDYETRQAYYDYTIEITNLNNDYMAPDVTVVDEITKGRTEYFDGYVGVTEISTPLTSTKTADGPVETRDAGRTAGSVYVGQLRSSVTAADNPIPAEGRAPEQVDERSLVWKIGNMQPGETRTLKYRIKIKDSLLTNPAIAKTEKNGEKHKIVNGAYSYSENEERLNEEQTKGKNIVTHEFQNIYSISQKKVSEQVDKDDEGNFYLTYRIIVGADSSNDFPFKDYVIHDDFFNAGDESTKTTEGLEEFTTIFQDGYKLYENAYEDMNTPIPNDAKVVSNDKYRVVLNDTTKSFDLYLNDLLYCKDENGAPKVGAYTFEYKVKIGKDAVTVCNGKFQTQNVIIGNVGGTVSNNNQILRYQARLTVESKKWSRKATHQATAITTPEEVVFGASDNVYDASLTKIDTNKPTGFTAPAGSYHYFVVINEDADWDLTNATLKDELGEHMHYLEYARITAYNKSSNSTTNGDNASSALEKVQSGTPVKTSWFNINNLKSFTISPGNLGLNGTYAYVIDYYTLPDDLDSFSHLQVSNKFYVSGNVGGNYYLDPGKMMVEVVVDVIGTERFEVEKNGWYYEKPSVNDRGEILKSNGEVLEYNMIDDMTLRYKDSKNIVTSIASEPGIFGKIYWVIKVDGQIKSGRIIQEDTYAFDGSKGSRPLFIRDDAVVGIYKGKLEDGKDISSFIDVNDFKNNSGLQELAKNSDYVAAIDKNDPINGNSNYHHNLNIKFLKDIPLPDNNSLYIVVATEPIKPLDYKKDLDYFTYQNIVKTAENSTQKVKDIALGRYTVGSKDNIYKTTRAIYDVDGEGHSTLLYKVDDQYNPVQPITEFPSGGGTFIEWQIKVNWDGGIQGMVDIEDTLPSGVEPVYVNISKIGSDYTAGLGYTVPETETIPELINQGYTEKQSTKAGKVCTYYYNSNNNSLKWRIGPLKSGGSAEAREVVFQILCKVTDKALLMNPNEIKLNNSFSATALSNNKHYFGNAPAFITRQTMSKDVRPDYKENPSPYLNRIPFIIHANEKAQDLDNQSTQLTIVDELSKYLEVDIKTIKLYQGDTNTELGKADWSASIDESDTGTQILRINIPDSTHVRIEYNAVFTGKSNVTTPLSNTAHWAGSNSSKDTSWTQDYKFGMEGDISTSGFCQLEITKIDGDNISTTLQGAIFTVKEYEYKDGILQPKPNGEIRTATTGSDGVAIFSGSEGDRWMKHNTIYCIEETTSPPGYIRLDRPYYFLIAMKEAQENGSKDYPDYIKNLPESVNIKYEETYHYTARNYRRARIDKTFIDQDNVELEPIDGTYQFGLFETQNPATGTKPVQIVEIQYTGGQPVYRRISGGKISTISSASFNGLKLDTTYYVYELDAEGNVISDGTLGSTKNGTFVVSYPGSNSFVIHADTDVLQTVTINNTPTYELPETGGSGNEIYYYIGILVILGGLILLSSNKERKNNA